MEHYFHLSLDLLHNLSPGQKKLKTNFALALIIVGFAAFSFFKSGGSHWTQTLAIFIFAPVSILGGLCYNKRQKDNPGN